MLIDVSSLSKVLELEQKKGFSDTAVIGGLDKFMRNWVSRTTGAIADRNTLTRFKTLRLSNPGYREMTVQQRQGWAKDVLTLMNELESGKPTKPVKPPKQPATKKVQPVARVKKPSPSAIKSLDEPATVIKGLGPSLTPRFAKLGVKTVRDMLYFFPTRHVDYSQLKTVSQLAEGTEETI
ncbi:MAG: DNA helicase RecG, partial [Dehalococcoidales bacterium]|nr:DNA helicase RecG [Dehalococcoidales bacterium]